MTKDEAIKMALGALEGLYLEFERTREWGCLPIAMVKARCAIAGLRSALANTCEAFDEPICKHQIADARNAIVKSGYVCVDCGALFSAADHKDEPCPECGGNGAGGKHEEDCSLLDEVQEPVGYFYKDHNGSWRQAHDLQFKEAHTPFYAATPRREWIGLTEEERVDAALTTNRYRAVINAEAKLKEKNHGE